MRSAADTADTAVAFIYQTKNVRHYIFVGFLF